MEEFTEEPDLQGVQALVLSAWAACSPQTAVLVSSAWILVSLLLEGALWPFSRGAVPPGMQTVMCHNSRHLTLTARPSGAVPQHQLTSYPHVSSPV